MALQQNYPGLQDFITSFSGNTGGANLEIIDQELYDRVIYPTAGIAGSATFFQVPQGSGISTESGNTVTTPKSAADTNMTQNGQLPSPQAYFVRDIQLDFDAGSVGTTNLFVTESPTFYNGTAAATIQAGAIDKNAVLNAGFASFTVGTKPYLTLGPLKRFPPAARLRMDTSSSLAGTNAQPGAYGSQFVYADGVLSLPTRKLNPGVGIPTGMNFAVIVGFPILTATPSTFNGRLQCVMAGWQIRAVQ